MATTALSMATNFFSNQFQDMYYDGYFTRDELVNMAGLRSKIPTIQALTRVITYMRPHKMCFDLKEEIRIQGTITSSMQLSKQVERDLKTYENEISDKCNKILQKMKDDNKDDPEYCTSAHAYFMGHNPLTCVYCKYHVRKNVRGSRGGTRRGSITSSDFVQDYYSRNDVIEMIENMQSCQCCHRHQINMSDLHHISRCHRPRPKDENIKVYPNTVHQEKMPKTYHCQCNCNCVNLVSELAGYMEDLDSYRSYPGGYDQWNTSDDEYDDYHDDDDDDSYGKYS